MIPIVDLVLCFLFLLLLLAVAGLGFLGLVLLIVVDENFKLLGRFIVQYAPPRIPPKEGF